MRLLLPTGHKFRRIFLGLGWIIELVILFKVIQIVWYDILIRFWWFLGLVFVWLAIVEVDVVGLGPLNLLLTLLEAGALVFLLVSTVLRVREAPLEAAVLCVAHQGISDSEAISISLVSSSLPLLVGLTWRTALLLLSASATTFWWRWLLLFPVLWTFSLLLLWIRFFLSLLTIFLS